MAEVREPDPTGAFGEGAPEGLSDQALPSLEDRRTEQSFSRWPLEEYAESGGQDTAEHAPLIDRPRGAT
ncbi:MAG TPA: hypothetical protein VK894_04175 [Jiangellales bacterium]|nr:hypothetical protein [Jiangellales bacterium]